MAKTNEGAVRETVLTQGDHYMHLADLTSYSQPQERLIASNAGPSVWARKAILNVASSGKFLRDRTIGYCSIPRASQLGPGSPKNVPGREEGNWRWRSTESMLSSPAVQWLRDLTERSRRSGTGFPISSSSPRTL
jgi:4-alpha-glucanotransferase